MSAAIQIVENPIETARSNADQLGAEITELCSYIYAAESRLLTLIREFDEKEYWAGQGLCSCAHWLNFKCGIGMNAAREKVRVAHALAGLPKINEAFSTGKLSYSKVRAMTRIADETNEDYLLMISEHGTAHHVEKLVAKYRTAKRLQDAEIANEQYMQREVTHYYDHDGCLVIKARLPAEQGALIVKALEMAMDTAFAEAGSDVDVGADPVRDNIAARRADALAEVAETYMDNNESSGSTADRYQQDSATIEISVLEDTTDEPDETFTVTLSNPANTSIGTIPEAVITIQDNDAAATNTPPAASSGGGGGGAMSWLLLVLGGCCIGRWTRRHFLNRPAIRNRRSCRPFRRALC